MSTDSYVDRLSEQRLRLFVERCLQIVKKYVDARYNCEWDTRVISYARPLGKIELNWCASLDDAELEDILLEDYQYLVFKIGVPNPPVPSPHPIAQRVMSEQPWKYRGG